MIDEEMENEWNNLFELKGKLDAINKILKLHEDNELIFDKNEDLDCKNSLPKISIAKA